MPDLILLDLGLSAGDGFVVLERLQALEALAHIPVVVVSGRNRAVNEGRVLAAKAKAFLQKPVKNSELLAVVEQILGPKPHSAPMIYDIGSGLAPSSLSASSFTPSTN